jgi:hypothetical protein
MFSVSCRPVAILALIATAGLIAGCGASKHPATSTTAYPSATTNSRSSSGTGTGRRAGTVAPLTKAQAIGFARAVNLTAADVPGFTATARHGKEHKSAAEKRLERGLTLCVGKSVNSPMDLAEESSMDFKFEHAVLHFSVSSEVSVAQTPALAAKELSAIRGNHVRECLSHYLDLLLKYQILKGQRSRAINPNSISLSISDGTPPAPGATGSFWWRITATVAIHHIKLPYYVDILGFVYGPAEVSMSSSGALRPFPAATQEHLYLLLLRRAEAHRL